MTADAAPPRPPSRAETGFLLLFHAVLSAAFLVAYLTGDEDTYGMHLFAGYTVLAALGVRLVAALLAPAGSPLALPRPATSPTAAWLRRLATGERQALRGRSPIYAWMALAMLVFTALVAASGWVADRTPSVEELHETVAELTPAVIFAHVVVAAALHWLRRLATAREAAAAAGLSIRRTPCAPPSSPRPPRSPSSRPQHSPSVPVIRAGTRSSPTTRPRLPLTLASPALR